MAVCEQGYLCEVCGADVGEIAESDLYLRYILGEVPFETLHTRPERHIRCNPALAQFIIHPRFPPILAEGPFAKSGLDPDFVAAEERRVSRAFARLLEVTPLGIPITDYPLPPVTNDRGLA